MTQRVVVIISDYLQRLVNMASATRVCRLCRAVVAPNRSIYLFSASAVKNKWASRIGQLLEIPVDKAITPYSYV